MILKNKYLHSNNFELFSERKDILADQILSCLITVFHISLVYTSIFGFLIPESTMKYLQFILILLEIIIIPTNILWLSIFIVSSFIFIDIFCLNFDLDTLLYSYQYEYYLKKQIQSTMCVCINYSMYAFMIVLLIMKFEVPEVGGFKCYFFNQIYTIFYK